jgi:hypothetical protein
VQPPRIPGELIRSQAVFLLHDALGVQHTIDVHWKVSKPQVFAGVATYEELMARSDLAAGLGPSVRIAGASDALAIACVHRVAHHSGRDRLIWIYDIHLLLEAMTATDRGRFLSLAEHAGIARVCESGVAAAVRLFGAPAHELTAELGRLAAARPQERSAVYTEHEMRKVDVLASDLAALSTWRARLRLVREHLFPPVAYMRQRYRMSSRAWLPALYAWRAASGAAGWFRRNGEDRRSR